MLSSTRCALHDGVSHYEAMSQSSLPRLGVQAVKIAVAMGAEVTVISTSDKKREEALGHLGAQHFLISKDEAAMKVRGPS